MKYKERSNRNENRLFSGRKKGDFVYYDIREYGS